MLRYANGILDRLSTVIGSLFFWQIPQFIQIYIQRLSGHVTEISLQVSKLENIAQLTGKTLTQYIQKFLQNSDPDFVLQGTFMQRLVERKEFLSEGLYSLQTASIVSKPYDFLMHYDYDIAQSALQAFQPGLALTTEGIVYAVVGAGAGCLLYRLISFCLRLCTSVVLKPWRRTIRVKLIQ